jgi:hypothetical protein
MMWSLTSPRVKRISGSKNFRSSPQKDFSELKFSVHTAAREGAELALRMRRCGVSRWHPDPANECERIEAEQGQQLAK